MSKFITYDNVTIMHDEFDKLVNQLVLKFDNFYEIDDFVIIEEENPISFYALLLALWSCNKKVVFPNKDFFEGENFQFVKYIINKQVININCDYQKCDVLEGDTVLFSSGSTGKPKGIVHKKENFFKNAKAVLNRLKINKLTSVTPLKPYLVSALSHFLVHKLSNSHLIFIDINNISIVKKISSEYKRLSYVGSPMHILSMMPYISNKNPELFFSSGDIFYVSVLEDIFEKYPKTIFFNVYGMAELAGRIFINKITLETEKLLHKSIGESLNIIDVIFKENEVHLRSDILFEGYIKENLFYQQKKEYFGSADKVLKYDKHYEFYGRLNDEIKVAGNKVSLKHIEQLVSASLGETITPIVVSEKHNLFGNIIVLVLYTSKKIKIQKSNVIKNLKKELKNYELPHKVYNITEIPYTQTMKIDRKKIINQLELLEELQ